MELFCTPFSTWPSFVLYSNQLTYFEYETSNIYTTSVFQTRAKERHFHSFHYILVRAETSLYQFRRVGLLVSWLSANWIVGELVCRRVVHKPCGSAGLNTCKMREQKMREYIAGVRVICGRKMREREIMCGARVSQVKPSNCFRHLKN